MAALFFENEWARKSAELASAPGYLDDLSEIYRVDEAVPRPIEEGKLKRIREAYHGVDDTSLVKLLLELDKFPYDDPYASLLRRFPHQGPDANPKSVARIAATIRLMSWDQLERAIRAPKVANRQLGTRFTEWFKTFGYPSLSEPQLLRERGTAMLAGSEEDALRFTKKHLGYTGDKRPDLLIKTNGQYIVGEAKFFTDSGGHQDRQFEDAMGLVNNQGSFVPNARAVAILDGVVWKPGRSKMYKVVSTTKHDVMSALLLPRYLEGIS